MSLMKTFNGYEVVDETARNNITQASNSLSSKLGNIENLETTNKADLVVAINEVRNSISAGGTEAAVTMSTTTTSAGASKSYTIKQGSNTIGVIDIPKDMVVSSGEVVTNPDGKDAGTYIKLTLANVSDPLYINVGTLVDIYKAKSSATQVQIAIDTSTREVSATIVAGSIGTTEIADGAVTSVKISDGNITKAKLSTTVQESLTNADNAKSELSDHTGNTTVHVTAAEKTNWNAAKTHADSVHAPSDAEKNQNAFSNIKVGSTTIAADLATDTLTLVAGSNVTLTPDVTEDKVTIAATDTVTTVTTSGTGNAITALSATDGKITATKGSTFLTAHPSIITSTDTTSTATPAHGETITMVDSVTRDSNGHVTKINTKTVTLPTDNNTDTKVKNTLATTTKAYVTGTTSDITNTGTQVFDTGVYLGTTAGELVATTFTGALSGNAATATKLTDSKTIQTNLASTSTASFDGSSNITPGVTGILPITNGGTGASTLEAAKENLGIGVKVVPVTQVEYTALGDAVKTDGNIYAVTDGLPQPWVSGIHLGNSVSSDSMAYIYQEDNNGNIYFRYADGNGNTQYTDIRKLFIRTVIANCSNVAITNKSANGAYYVKFKSFSDIISNTYSEIVGLMIVDWSGATASFVPYYQSGMLCFMSDVSQTVTNISVQVMYRC